MTSSNAVVNLAIPSGDMYDKSKGTILKARLSYINNHPGDGRIIRIENVHEVNNELKLSVLNTKRAAERLLVGKSFEFDTTLQFTRRYQTIQGRSWKMALALF
jgi:hypothetical protein